MTCTSTCGTGGTASSTPVPPFRYGAQRAPLGFRSLPVPGQQTAPADGTGGAIDEPVNGPDSRSWLRPRIRLGRHAAPGPVGFLLSRTAPTFASSTHAPDAAGQVWGHGATPSIVCPHRYAFTLAIRRADSSSSCASLVIS